MVSIKIKMDTNSQSMTDQHFMIGIMRILKFSFNYINLLMGQLMEQIEFQ